MSAQDYIKFLGTAGARFVVARQLRASAGTLMSLKNQTILLDPGPGSLVRCAKSRPPVDVMGIDAIILSHSHIDHSNDVNAIIDSMTYGGVEKHGILFAPDECLSGENAVVLKYLRGFLERIVVLEPEKEYHIGPVIFSTSMRHVHPVETYGLSFAVNGRKISFMTDTRYFPDLLRCYRNSEILVMNVVRFAPHKDYDCIDHLCYRDLSEILQEIRPKLAILTHFGGTMLAAKPSQVAMTLASESGIPVRAAYDGMTLSL